MSTYQLSNIEKITIIRLYNKFYDDSIDAVTLVSILSGLNIKKVRYAIGKYITCGLTLDSKANYSENRKKYPDAKYVEIRRLHKEGYAQRIIASKVGVSPNCVRLEINRSKNELK